MISRSVRLGLALAASALALRAPAQTPPPAAPAGPAPALTPAGDPNENVQLNLPDADIDTVISALENLTGRIALRPQQLQTATYNIRLKKPIPKHEAILAVETVLALNGIALAPLGDKFIRIVNANNVRFESPEMIPGTTLDRPATGKVATKVFQLEFARVQELQGLFQAILNPFYGGPIVLPNANAFLITDSISNLQRVERLLTDLDQPVTAGLKPKFYQLLNGAKASDLVAKIRTILTGALQQQLGTATTYSADDRTNQIILVSDPRLHPFFDDLIKKLDQRADPNTRNDVIYLKNAKAADVVNVLSRIISGQTTAIQRQNPNSVRPGQPGAQPVQPAPGAPGQPAQPTIISASSTGEGQGGSNEFSSLMTVVNDDRSNAVVVSGTADDIRLVKSLVDKLDIVLAQVRIEVVIAEVTLDDNDESGIKTLGLRVEGDKLVGFSGASDAGISVTAGTITRPGVTGPFDLAADLAISSTLRKRNNAIVTVPAIVTSHGKQAKFFNGETRPVVTGTIQSGVGGGTGGLASSSTVTQQQIGTTLTVTPFIGADGSVQLDLVQDVQDVIGEVPVDNNTQYIIGQRQTTSYVTTKSGEIIVLGGFRKNATIRERNRLGPIPFIGDLFGPRTKSNNRQELIFFLRPTVLTNSPAIDNAEMLKRIEEWSTRDQIKKEIDPNYVAPPQSVIDRLLSK